VPLQLVLDPESVCLFPSFDLSKVFGYCFIFPDFLLSVPHYFSVTSFSVYRDLPAFLFSFFF